MGYNPSQLRAPAGDPDGGQWVSEGGGGLRTIASLRADVARNALGPNIRATGPRRTPFDAPDVLLARYNNALTPSTHLINTPEREALRARIADEMYGNGGTKGHEAWMVIGGPGSGKSTYARENLITQNGALEIDSDRAKLGLPEYKGGAGANATHEESSQIAADVLKRATLNGDNVVVPMVGRSASKAAQMVDAFKAAGYKVHVVYIDVNPQEATIRALKRFRGPSKRFVDPDYILNHVGTKPRGTYAALRRHSSVTSFARYDYNGRSPRLVERGPRLRTRSRRRG